MLLFWIATGFLAIRTAVVLFNWLDRPWLKPVAPNEGLNDTVSILIPARNEAHNLPNLLDSLLSQSYPHWSATILDDHSEDDTAKVVMAYAAKDARIKVVQGQPLPDGWLGKNWACHQLAAQAEGDWWLFTDADVEWGRGALATTLAFAKKEKSGLLSLFPEQKMKSLSEKVIVPIMHILLLTLLPLRLVRKSRNPAFAAANGQFMLFHKDAYQPFEWHSRLKSTVTEDIEILRAMKRDGLQAATLLGNGLVYCRMYRSWREGVEGFTKNLFAGFGRSLLLMLGYHFLTVWVWLILVWIVPLQWLLLPLGLSVVLGTVLSRLNRTPIIIQLGLQPLQSLVLCIISWRSAWFWYTRKAYWKGRKVVLPSSAAS